MAMTRAMSHAKPAISLTLTVNINADKTLLLLVGIVWLLCLALSRLGRWLSRVYEIGRAVIVVAWRRVRRALREIERRIEWTFSGLAYGPVLGMG